MRCRRSVGLQGVDTADWWVMRLFSVRQLLSTACSHTFTPLIHNALWRLVKATLVQASTGPKPAEDVHSRVALPASRAPWLHLAPTNVQLNVDTRCGLYVELVPVLCGHQGGNVPRCKPQQHHIPDFLPASRQGRSGANLGSRTQRHQRMMPTPVISCCSTPSRMKPWPQRRGVHKAEGASTRIVGGLRFSFTSVGTHAALQRQAYSNRSTTNLPRSYSCR
jgi:hypothetical protein